MHRRLRYTLPIPNADGDQLAMVELSGGALLRVRRSVAKVLPFSAVASTFRPALSAFYPADRPPGGCELLPGILSFASG